MSTKISLPHWVFTNILSAWKSLRDVGGIDLFVQYLIFFPENSVTEASKSKLMKEMGEREIHIDRSTGNQRKKNLQCEYKKYFLIKIF